VRRKDLRIHGGVDPGALEVIDGLQPYNALPERRPTPICGTCTAWTSWTSTTGCCSLRVRHEAVMWGTPGTCEGQLVIERFVDDGADYRFVPDRSVDTGVRADMSLLVALGPGLPGERLPVVTRLRELLALVRDDI